MEEGHATVGHASIRWRRDGSGPAIVFLPGFPLSGHTWDSVILHLRDRFTCYTADLVGLGHSRSSANDDHSSPGQARVMQGMLRQFGVDSYALVGNDTGGWIARELALIDGERVSHLILTNTEIPHHRPPWIPMYQVMAQVPGFASVIRQILKSAAFRGSPLGFGGCFYDSARIEGEFLQRFVEPLISEPGRMEGAMRFLRQMKFKRIDEFATLHGRLSMPTLFLWGANDPTFPEPTAQKMVPQFANVAGFHSIANAKLFFYEEHPREVAEHIDRLLSGLGGPQLGASW